MLPLKRHLEYLGLGNVALKLSDPDLENNTEPSQCQYEEKSPEKIPASAAKQRKLTPWHMPAHSTGMESAVQLHSQHRGREMCSAEAAELIPGLGTVEPWQHPGHVGLASPSPVGLAASIRYKLPLA